MPISAQLAQALPQALASVQVGNELINYLNALAFFATQYKTDSSTVGLTETAANMAGASECVLNMTGTLGAGANLTTPTAAQIIAAMPAGMQQVNQSYILRVINSGGGAFSWTIVAGTGVTLNGTMTIAQNTFRDFQVTITGVGANAAVTIQQIGTGTNS